MASPLRTRYMDDRDGFKGSIEEYITVTKGNFRMICACGWYLKVEFRKEHKKNTAYQFKIVHRSRNRSYTSKDPQVVEVFSRMMKVATYADCDVMRPISF